MIEPSENGYWREHALVYYEFATHIIRAECEMGSVAAVNWARGAFALKSAINITTASATAGYVHQPAY